MFKNFLLITILSMPLISQAQNILPVFKGNSDVMKKIKPEISKIDKEIAKLYEEKKNLDPNKLNKDIIKKRGDELILIIDSLHATNDSLKNIYNTKTKYPLITFYGSATVGAGTDFLSTITSTGQLNAIVNPFGNTFVGIGANLLFANPDKGVNKDSVDFKSLMFPETGKFGVLASVSHKFHLNWKKQSYAENESRQHFLVPQFSFAYRMVTIDTITNGFKILNYNFGLKYQLEGMTKDSNRIAFSAMPYYNLFNIPNENADNFLKYVNDSLFSSNNKGAAIQGLGIKMTLQYNNFIFFFDFRRNIKTSKNMSNDNPFKGTLVNVGFATNLNILVTKKKKEEE